MIKKGSKWKVCIKPGQPVFQDRSFYRWPDVEWGGRAPDPDLVFDGTWTGEFWDCVADGFGRMKSRGEEGDYGSGSLFVSGVDKVLLLPRLPESV